MTAVALPLAVETIPAGPRVLGLDLSLTCTGLAGPGWTGTIKPGTRRGVDRITHIRDAIGTYLAGVTLACVEGPSYGNQGNGRQAGHHERAGLWWIVRVALAARGVPVAVVAPATLKKYAAGKGNADKAAVMREVARRYPWFDGGEDEADALVAAAMAADWLGAPFAGVPKTHRDALSAVDWPLVVAS